MNRCKELNTYFGQENQQLERSSRLLMEVARIRFDKCRLTNVLKNKISEKKKQ